MGGSALGIRARQRQVAGSEAGRRVHYLVLPAGVRRVWHVVAPVLRPDLVLLLRQELQLLVARLHVVVQAAQVVLTPL